MMAAPNFGLTVFAAVSLVVLTACGFHLREGVELPEVLESTYLQSKDLYSGIATELRLELQAAGAEQKRDCLIGLPKTGTPIPRPLRQAACSIPGGR